MKICLYGASSNTLDVKYTEAAADFGRMVGEGGHTLVFGGGATGLMGAAAKAVIAAGGSTMGIAPKFFDTPGVLFKDGTTLVFTETMRERKQMMEDVSDCFVMVPGGIGTFEEFFECLTLKQLGKVKKPLAIFDVGGYYSPLVSLMEHAVSEGFADKSLLSLYKVFTDAGQLLEFLEETKNRRQIYD